MPKAEHLSYDLFPVWNNQGYLIFGMLRKLSLYNNVFLTCSTKDFSFLVPLCLGKNISMFFFCSQETVVRIRSSEVWYISLTVIICFKKWYLLSADLSASSLLGLTLWLLFQLVPVADSSSNCQQFFHLSPKWDFSCTFKRRRSSELQCVSVQAAGNATGRKE